MKDLPTILEEALSLDVPAREAYLESVCGFNHALRQQIEQMIAAATKADVFFSESDGSPSSDSATVTMPNLEGAGTVIDRYKLLQQIGEGGMGVVYMAEQTAPVVRKVALKIIKLGMDTRQVVARFEAERQALALMDHPNIARVLDGGTTESGRPYFVMELVQGVPITVFCDRNKLSTSERLKLFIPVCHAIQSAHQKGIIHRDIKPSNVLVTLHHSEPMPKVIDFGIAKAINQNLTEKTLFTNFATMIGTPAYMSPEQAEMSSLDVDTRTDVYSLGVLLYELLTGTTPFPEKRLRSAGYGEIQRIIAEEDPEKPSTRLNTLTDEEKATTAHTRGTDVHELARLLKGDLDCIVMKCLEKDRRRRYETASALAADAALYLQSEPITARPSSTLYRFQKAFHRNPIAYVAALAAFGVLTLATIVSSWQATRAFRAKREAETARQTAVENAARATLAESKATTLLLEERTNSYVANLIMVQAAWEENNVRRARGLLAATADYPDRNFEWHFWNRLTHADIRTFTGHTQMIFAVAFSPDSKHLLTTSWDHTAKVHDIESGQTLLTFTNHTDAVNSGVFSPDGTTILTSSADGSARLWDAADGRELRRFSRNKEALNCAAFSHDARRIVTVGKDTKVTTWDSSTGSELLTFPGHTYEIIAAAFSPDDRYIVTGGRDKTAKLWSASNGTLLVEFKGHSGTVNSVAFSPNGTRIATGGDRSARIWDLLTGREVRTLERHISEVNWVSFSPDGSRIATASDDRLAKIWDADTGQEVLTLNGHVSPLDCVTFSPDGRWIATGSGDWRAQGVEAKVWSVQGVQQNLILKGHEKGLYCATFSPDGKQVVTCTGEEFKKVRTWDSRTGKELHSFTGHSDQVVSSVFSPDGQRILTASKDRTAKIWDSATAQEIQTLTGHSGWVTSASYSPDGQYIATAGTNQVVELWRSDAASERFILKERYPGYATASFAPDSHKIVSVSTDNSAVIWECSSGRVLRVLLAEGASRRVGNAVFSPEGTVVAAVYSDDSVIIWNAQTGNKISTLVGTSDQLWAMAISPDGRRVLTGCKDGTAKLWLVDNGAEILTLKYHTAPVRGVAFSPDGKRIITASWDSTAAIWDAERP